MITIPYIKTNAIKDPYIRKSIIDQAIQSLLTSRFNCYVGAAGEVVVHDPEHVEFGLNPDHGCRAVLKHDAEPTCQCATAGAFGLCEHTVAGFIYLNSSSKEAQLGQAA